MQLAERQRAEKELIKRTTQLETANKELEAFSYSVSHDLRAPLRAIDGFSRVILEEYKDKLDDEGKRYLNIVRDNTQKMGQLIEDLLALSRLGRKEMQVSRIDMAKLAKTVFDELKDANPGRNIQLEIKTLPPAYGDQAMIHQVFVNLLSNAIKFTQFKEKAVIEIGFNTQMNENVYYVKDNGVGFDMQYSNKLFGVFQRLHSAEDFDGTGVGLAIVQRIIHRHGGKVWAEGKVNEGATFYFNILDGGIKNDRYK
jgi:two-component system sensor kinase